MSARNKSGKGTTTGTKKKPPGNTSTTQAVVQRGTRAAATSGKKSQSNEILAPVGYKMRPVQPAKNYDVVSFARAMNDDFGPRVKKLFDPERESVMQALQTGIYIGWRCPEFKHDCQRVNDSSKCFCGHLLSEHAKYTAKSGLVPCKTGGCRCKGFAFIPARPEEVGEFWFQRRRDFDPSTWRAKCRCKHTHEEHDPTGLHRCRKCGCGVFDSNFLCAACDKHWEQHETFFESEADRIDKGLPVGKDYYPFAEIPSLRNMVLTGHDDEDMSYMAVQYPPDMQPLPPSAEPADNNTVVPFGGAKKKTGFRPVYD